MNTQSYLQKEISQIVLQPKYYKYWCGYNLLKLKRFILHTIVIFLLQFTVIINLPAPHPGLAMYPPIGIAYIMFAFLGRRAILGLLLSGFCGYWLKQIPFSSLLLYLIADLSCGYLGAVLGQKIFTTDLRIFFNLLEVINFIKTNAIVCFMASFIRIIAFTIVPEANIMQNNIFFTHFNLWLADLNAILIISGFVMSWLYVPFSREKIANKTIGIIPIILLITVVIFSLLFMENDWLIYLIAAIMLTSIYFAWNYGHLVATFLLFITASIYMTYFINIQYKYSLRFNIWLYTIPPSILLLFTFYMFYIAHVSIARKVDLREPIQAC